jgi:hypothetical protein
MEGLKRRSSQWYQRIRTDGCLLNDKRRARDNHAPGADSFSSGNLQRLGEHTCQYAFKRHRVTAYFPCNEEIAIAFPSAIGVLNYMRIVPAIQAGFEMIKFDALSFLSISPGLIDLADHPIIHSSSFPFPK